LATHARDFTTTSGPNPGMQMMAMMPLRPNWVHITCRNMLRLGANALAFISQTWVGNNRHCSPANHVHFEMMNPSTRASWKCQTI